MIVSINQPAYLPAMRYFDRIRESDLHIVLDHVTFEKGSFVNRTQIRQRDGRVMWMTIPVEKGKPINETWTIGWKWRRKHTAALYQAYGMSITLAGSDLLFEVIWPVPEEFGGADTPQVLSSDLGGAALGTKSTLILNLCKEAGADVYLSGPHGKDYLDLPAFDKAGIEVRFQEMPTEYPVLSAVDDLFGKVKA